MRLLLLFIALLISSLITAQSNDQIMEEIVTEVESRDSCDCLTCLPIIEKRLQKTQDNKLIANGYKEIAAVLWNCTRWDDNNTFTARQALQYSLMFHDSKEVRTLLDSISIEDFGQEPFAEWRKIDSPWQGKILATAREGGSYIMQEEEGYSKQLCLKTDSGWISTELPTEGWAGAESLAYIKDKKGQPQALLVEYGINSYGTGGGTTWHHAYLMDLQSLQTIYSQNTYYAEEVFCGKYGPDPDCVRDPCTVKQPLYIENNHLIIGPTSITKKDSGYSCPAEEEATPPAGVYEYKDGYLLPVK